MSELVDSRLVAFVDGELDPDSMREVARAIAADPVAQDKVRRLRLSTPLIRAAMDKPEHRAVPDDIVRTVEQPAAWWKRALAPWPWATALAASIALLIGLGGGFLAGTREAIDTAFEDKLIDDVAGYHSVYASEVEHQVEVPAARREHIETWLGRRLHRPIQVPDLADRGWKFEGARLLVTAGRPVAQFIYVRKDDQQHPLGLCIAYGGNDTQGVRTVRRGDLNLALWESKGYAYVLVGWVSTSSLADLVAELSSKLQNG